MHFSEDAVPNKFTIFRFFNVSEKLDPPMFNDAQFVTSTTGWGTFSTYAVITTLIFNYNLICVINTTFSFGLRDLLFTTK